jgi:hypothetical protein
LIAIDCSCGFPGSLSGRGGGSSGRPGRERRLGFEQVTDRLQGPVLALRQKMNLDSGHSKHRVSTELQSIAIAAESNPVDGQGELRRRSR